MKAFIVDSFTNEPFKGNPAGVCIQDQEISAEKMQLIAKEFNLSETAFIIKTGKETEYSIRYFSPKMEIPLCGHATLASAKVLFESTTLSKVRFITGQNLELLIRKSKNNIIMEFPVYDVEEAEVPERMPEALGIKEITCCAYNSENNMLLLEIDDPILLKELKPDFEALLKTHNSIHGVLVTSPSDNSHFDFYSRYFWPWSGSNEDPVTGATHTFLANYWSKKLGKKKMRSYQASERSGFMEVELTDDNRLLIKAQAIVVLEGNLFI